MTSAQPIGPALDGFVHAHAEAATALLSALIAAESINPPGATVGPATVAAEWLASYGLAHEIIAADPTKPNIVAQVRNGARDAPHLVLNAHLDTVPPGDPAAWTKPPLSLTPEGERLFGLGAGNMKAAATAMLLAYRWLAENRDAWRGRLTLTLVVDECTFGPDGAAYLLGLWPDLAGDMLICGEGPGGMGLAVAEKGLMWVRLTAVGRVGQGMLTARGGSATTRLAAALTTLDALNDLAVPPPLSDLAHPGNTEGMRPSVNVGRIGGGSFISQAASEAWAEIDFRLPPGLSMAEMSARLDALCAGGHLRWELLKGWEANWSEPSAPPALALRTAAEAVRGEAPHAVTRLPASDASRWRARGVPAVCYGPQPELASGVDDYVMRSDFLDCITIYARAACILLPGQPAG